MRSVPIEDNNLFYGRPIARGMRKSTASSLLAVIVLGLTLRLSPLTRFVYFGSDVGEYYRISRGVLATGQVALPYPGWGATYPYFPGMFFLVAGTSLGGLELSGSPDLVVPALAALIPAIVFLLAARLVHEDRAALLAAALVAVAMPHAFQTAHAIPATVGEFLAVAALFLWLRLPRDPRTWGLLVPLTLALIRTIAQDVAVMADGRIVERGPADRVLEQPEADYTKRLLADTPSLEAALAVAE